MTKMPIPPLLMPLSVRPEAPAATPDPVRLRSVHYETERHVALIGFTDDAAARCIGSLDLPLVTFDPYPSVRGFMATADPRRIDAVVVDADVFDPDVLGDILALRAWLSDHDSVSIIGTLDFSPGAFGSRLEQAGCTEVLKRTPEAIEACLTALVRRPDVSVAANAPHAVRGHQRS